jgi:hypothetical protein
MANLYVFSLDATCDMLKTNELPVRHVPAWVPGAWWSKFGRDWRFAFDDLFNVPFDRVRKQMVCAHRHDGVRSVIQVL